MNIYEEMGQRITKERKLLGLSREKLAEFMNVSPYFIGQLERGERKMGFDTFIKISNVLHVSLDYLAKGDRKPESNNDLLYLIDKCSDNEKRLAADVLKASLPHLGNLNL